MFTQTQHSRTPPARFYLVDFFDDETTFNILRSKGFSNEEAEYLAKRIGGVPWIIEEIIGSDDPESILEELYKQTRARLKYFFVNHPDDDEVKNVVDEILRGKFELSKKNVKVIRDLVKAEIIFYDPINANVRFQTKLYEMAAKELLSGMSGIRDLLFAKDTVNGFYEKLVSARIQSEMCTI